jgi:hypothetical protein
MLVGIKPNVSQRLEDGAARRQTDSLPGLKYRGRSPDYDLINLHTGMRDATPDMPAFEQVVIVIGALSVGYGKSSLFEQVSDEIS